MIPNVLLVSAIWAIIITIITNHIMVIVENRKAEKRRQSIKRYYAQMYYAAPSEREAEYWLDKYNKGV